MSAPFLAFLVWMLIPLLVFISKALRGARYESKMELYPKIGKFDARELSRRRKELISTDDHYRRIHSDTKRWVLVTIVWWGCSLPAVLILKLLHLHA